MVVEHLPTNDHETQEKKLCQNNEKKKVTVIFWSFLGTLTLNDTLTNNNYNRVSF